MDTVWGKGTSDFGVMFLGGEVSESVSSCNCVSQCMAGRLTSESAIRVRKVSCVKRGFDRTLPSSPLWMERMNSVLMQSRRGTIGRKYEEMLGNITAVQPNCDWMRRVFWMVGLKTAKHAS